MQTADGQEISSSSVLRTGKATVTKSIYAYEKRSKKTGTVIDKLDVHQPSFELETHAVWCEVPLECQQAYFTAKETGVCVKKGKRGKRNVEVYEGEYDRGCLHAIEHVLCSICPLVVTCDPRDLSCQHTRRDGDVNRYYLLLFETTKGGLGIAEKLAENWIELLTAAYEAIANCPCALGCLSCIYSPSCGDKNSGLDKPGAELLLSLLLGKEAKGRGKEKEEEEVEHSQCKKEEDEHRASKRKKTSSAP